MVEVRETLERSMPVRVVRPTRAVSGVVSMAVKRSVIRGWQSMMLFLVV